MASVQGARFPRTRRRLPLSGLKQTLNPVAAPGANARRPWSRFGFLSKPAKHRELLVACVCGAPAPWHGRCAPVRLRALTRVKAKQVVYFLGVVLPFLLISARSAS